MTSIIIIIVILIIGIVAFAIYERIVCKEVCTIYCNSPVFIDQLCGVNADILKTWRRFGMRLASTEPIGYYEIKKNKEDLLFREKEAKELFNGLAPTKYQHSVLKSIVLAKHKLNHQEVEVGITIAKTQYDNLLGNLEFLISILDSETRTFSNWSFGEKRLICFQHESNMFFYGALEGICSFPRNTLELFGTQSARMKHLPLEIGLKKRKKDYLQFQEIEAQKAEDLLKSVTELMGQDEMELARMTSMLFRRDVYMFIAGSKSLQNERDLFSNVISQLQTKWSPKNINVYGLSYQNFEHEVVINGQQADYNSFIKSFADIVVFVLNGGEVGSVTFDEFNIAMEAFKKNNKPTIFVYNKISESVSDEVLRMHDKINEEKQYWQEFDSDNELRLMIQNDLSDYLQKVYEEMVQK